MKKILLSFITFLLSTNLCFAAASRNFNGTTDKVDFGNSTTFNLTSAVSICVWLNPNTVVKAFRHYLRKPAHNNDTNPYAEYNMYQDGGASVGDGVVTVLLSSGGSPSFTVSNNNVISANKWQFVCMTWDKGVNAGKPQTYINGIEVGYSSQTAVTTNLDTSIYNLLAGLNEAGNSPYNGKMAYIMLYSRKLSIVEIFQIMFKPGSIPNGLVGYWPIWGANSPEIDISGNGNSGTVTGTTTSSDGPPVMLGGKGN